MEIGTARRVCACVAVASGAVLLSGCDVSIRDGSVSVGTFAGRASDEWTKRYTLAAGGRVEIVNLNGRVDVTAGEEGTVEVRATRTARALADETAREQLKLLTIDEKAGGGVVRLETRLLAPPRRASLEVRYQVSVPPSADVDLVTNNGAIAVSGLKGAVRASSTNGSVAGDGLSGTVDLTTVNGSIHADVNGVGPGGVTLESVNGSVDLRIPRQVKASVSARCANGRVVVAGLPVPAQGPRRSRTYQVELNGGGPKVDIETTNGLVRIDGKP